jgi:DNA polymerase elongation subunit (family B)
VRIIRRVRKSPSLRLVHSTPAEPPAPDPFLRLINAYYRRDRDSVTLVCRDDAGRVLTRRQKAEHAVFLRASQVDERTERELKNNEFVTAMRREGEWWRVVWRDRYVLNRVAKIGGWFEHRGIQPMEADVDPVRRYLTDNPIEIARPRRCYLDLEADNRPGLANKEQARMLAWSIVDDEQMQADGVRVLCPHDEDRFRCKACEEHDASHALDVANARVVFDAEQTKGGVVASGLLTEDTDEAERELIEALWRALEPYDQIVAWNGDGYDFPYLAARTAKRRIRVERERWLWLDQMVNFIRQNMSAAESGEEKQSFALAAVSKTVVKLKEQKLAGASGSETWKLWCENPDLLLRYNEHDTRLQALIERRTGYIELLTTVCQVMNTFPDSNGIKPTRQVEGFLLRLGLSRGMHFATYHYSESKEKFRGAHVEEILREGIVRDVHVCDFSGMYPSIMRSFNLSPETVRGRLPEPSVEPAKRPSYLAHLPEEKPKDTIPAGHALVPLTRVVVAQEPPGMLAAALEEMLRLRAYWSKLKASLPPGTPEAQDAARRDLAYKIAANSVYGVSGSHFSRFFVRDVAESTSLGGKWLITETIAAAKARGWRVIYGDTDSAFITGPTDAEFVAFVKWCNEELYPRLMREQGAARNFVSLAYEKKFRRAVFVSKKRYAASWAHYKGKIATKNSKPEIKGLEYKRGDSSRLARRMQFETIELLLREECDDPARYEALIETFKREVLEGELAREDFVISKRLSKELNQYAKKTKADGTAASQGAHVEVAHVLKSRGEEVREGARIEFIVVDGGTSPIRPIPAKDLDPTKPETRPDRFYLWETLVYPPTMRVLQAAFPDRDWTRWERVRPPKPRARKSKALPGQMGLGFGEEAPPASTT